LLAAASDLLEALIIVVAGLVVLLVAPIVSGIAAGLVVLFVAPLFASLTFGPVGLVGLTLGTVVLILHLVAGLVVGVASLVDAGNPGKGDVRSAEKGEDGSLHGWWRWVWFGMRMARVSFGEGRRAIYTTLSPI
jgi:hypothetical protein